MSRIAGYAVSLVRAWLYSVRGFVVMTISLALAFSFAVTGPPTNSEINMVADPVSRAFEDFGNDIEAAAIQLCRDLSPDVQAELCPGWERQRAEAPPPPPPGPPPEVERVDLVLNEPLAPEAGETELLGGPVAPSARRGRAEPSPRATSRRAGAERSMARRSAARAPPPRPARVVRAAAPVAPPKPPPPAGETSNNFIDHVSDRAPAPEAGEGWRDADHERAYERDPPEEEAPDQEEAEFYGWERSFYWDELH